MNRHIIPWLTVLLVVALASAALAEDPPLSYETALARAADTGTPVVLDFFTEW